MSRDLFIRYLSADREGPTVTVPMRSVIEWFVYDDEIIISKNPGGSACKGRTLQLVIVELNSHNEFVLVTRILPRNLEAK